MPAISENPKHYFLEKDRKASFKSWPFTERQGCSITKVDSKFFIDFFFTFLRENHCLLVFVRKKVE